ncbi:MAG: L,D-transpeptidase family protein [Nitrospirota bacterium]|nr:L,D-transpeptidase family protein [Nitrospirota bacterium]
MALFIAFILMFIARDGAAATNAVDKVVVVKSERVMQIVKNGTIIRSYQVALGQDPIGHKTRRGDKKTPEGTYLLDRRNPRSEFYKSIHISYPNETDRMRARREGVAPGGEIMIHGLPRGKELVGELHSVLDWTRGCIAVTNEEMDEIWEMIPDGTPIEIRP